MQSDDTIGIQLLTNNTDTRLQQALNDVGLTVRRDGALVGQVETGRRLANDLDKEVLVFLFKHTCSFRQAINSLNQQKPAFGTSVLGELYGYPWISQRILLCGTTKCQVMRRQWRNMKLTQSSLGRMRLHRLFVTCFLMNDALADLFIKSHAVSHLYKRPKCSSLVLDSLDNTIYTGSQQNLD